MLPRRSSPLRRTIKVDSPQGRRARRDRVAPSGTGHELAYEAFKNPGDPEHDEDTHHYGRRLTSGIGECVEAVTHSWEGQCPADAETRRPREGDCEELGNAMHGNPTAELDPEAMRREERDEGT